MQRFGRRAVFLAGVALLVACGGGSTTATTSTSGPAPTTTASTTTASTPAATTTSTTAATVTTSAQADPDAARLAAAGLIQVADLGEGWKELRAAPGPQPLSAQSCGNRPGGPFPKVTKDANQTGATAQYGDAQLYLSSSTTVFPDEASALEYVAIRNSPEWIECRRAGLERELRASSGNVITITVNTEVDPYSHSMVAGTTVFDMQEELKDGQMTGGASLFRHVFRQGRAVLFVEIDTAISTDEDTDAVGQQVLTAIDRALARLEA